MRLPTINWPSDEDDIGPRSQTPATLRRGCSVSAEASSVGWPYQYAPSGRWRGAESLSIRHCPILPNLVVQQPGSDTKRPRSGSDQPLRLFC